MTTWGSFGLIVCAFIVTPIVVLLRSRLRAGAVWYIGFPILGVSNHLGWTLGPFLFSAMAGWSLDLPTLRAHAYLLVFDMGFALVVTTMLFFAKRRQEREAAEQSDRIHKAIQNITADGVIEGPKGPYAPHRPWNVGTSARTPHGTKGRDGHGPYGIPMP
jgi:cytochrome c biogenesis protein CcdA